LAYKVLRTLQPSGADPVLHQKKHIKTNWKNPTKIYEKTHQNEQDTIFIAKFGVEQNLCKNNA